MRLTWRDGVTTLLAALIGLIAIAHLQGWSVPVVDSARGGSAAIGVVGLGMCIVGGSGAAITAKSGYTMLAGLMGGAALLLVIAGLITGWSVMVTLIAADTLLLYALTTARHALEGVLCPTPA
jgi:hypothetical protein